MINLNFIKDVKSNSVSLRLRKAYTGANVSSHSVLTDDVFSYIEFWFRKHKKILKTKDGKKNWLIHEFLSMALDQFMDEISCEITKEEIMRTRVK